MLDFTPKRISVDVPVDKLRSEFDVRADGSTCESTAEEMVNVGKVGNVLITADYVEIDGRTTKRAQLINNNTFTQNNPIVKCDILPFKWDELTKIEKAAVQAYALKRNYPEKGFRRYATEEDSLVTVTNMVEDLWVPRKGISEETRNKIVYDLLNFMPKSRAKKLLNSATNAYNQRLIVKARNLMKDEKITDTAVAAAKVGLITPDGIVQSGGIASRDKTFAELKQKQAALRKALVSYKNYGDHNLRLLRENKASGSTVVRITQQHHKDAVKLGDVAEDSLNRVTKEAAKYGYHTSNK